jgi:hypothetical protein
MFTATTLSNHMLGLKNHLAKLLQYVQLTILYLHLLFHTCVQTYDVIPVTGNVVQCRVPRPGNFRTGSWYGYTRGTVAGTLLGRERGRCTKMNRDGDQQQRWKRSINGSVTVRL